MLFESGPPRRSSDGEHRGRDEEGPPSPRAGDADAANDDGGESFLEIYVRHRGAARRELEARGLSPERVERRLGGVLILALNVPSAGSDGPSLRERLLERAREAAADPHWRPPG